MASIVYPIFWIIAFEQVHNQILNLVQTSIFWLIYWSKQLSTIQSYGFNKLDEFHSKNSIKYNKYVLC